MKWTLCFLVLSSAVVMAAGCSGSSETGGSASESTDSEAIVKHDHAAHSDKTPDLVLTDKTPDSAVTGFLAALRTGDDKTAEALLTTKAREETAKHDLSVQPPGTPNASYQVGDVEFANEQKTAAYVNSVWTETDAEGIADSYEIIWVLRHESKGWRIAGMATRLSADEPQPLFLNFEDPAEMLRKWEEAEAAVAARDETGTTESVQR